MEKKSDSLKARAYDLLAAIQGAQRELDQINQAISQAIQEEKKEKSEVSNGEVIQK